MQRLDVRRFKPRLLADALGRFGGGWITLEGRSMAKQTKGKKRTRRLSPREVEMRQVNRKKPSAAGIVCPLCGVLVARGSLVAHKVEAHGEKSHADDALPHRSDWWVSIVGGGLPTLGKRKR